MASKHLKLYGFTLLALLLLSTTAQALECDVAFRAKRTTTESNWYGKVEKPRFKSGIASGEGSSRKRCVHDALRPLRQDGWEIKYYSLQKVYETHH